MDTLKCTRCKKVLPVDSFWYNKLREKYDTPCKDCRNEQKRFRRKEMRINNRFTPSELDKSYRMKGLSVSIRETKTLKLILDRTIETIKDVYLLTSDSGIIIHCGCCGEMEVLATPAAAEKFMEFAQLFKEGHGKNCKA